MKDRIKKIRRDLGLTQQEFADRIGVKRNTIANYEVGRNAPVDSIVSLICREYNVREEWLRNGTGEMYEELTRAEMAANIVGASLGSEDDFIVNTFIALGQLTPTEWNVVKKIVEKIKTTVDDPDRT